MLQQLLESQPRAGRSATQIVLSVLAHTAVIGAAVFATGHAHVARIDEKPTRIIWPRAYVPLVPAAPKLARGTGGQRLPNISIDPDIVIPTDLMTLVLPGPQVDVTEFHTGTTLAVPGDVGSAMVSTGQPFRSDQVETPAAVQSGNVPPKYPEQLRAAGIEGRVLATFIIDTTGRAEPASIRFAEDGNALFEASVRSALTRMRFVAARIGGVKVRQLVEMPFVFAINR